MLVRKSISFKGVMHFAGRHLVWLTVWIGAITALYNFTHWSWMSIPWLPLSVIGTAVAFYVGFKNNQAYDRLWEGRKVWGGIVNSSRAFGSMVKAYLTNSNNELTETQLLEVKRRLIYRHIAWTYTLRTQLLVSTQWEHVNLSRHIGTFNQERMKKFGSGLFEEEVEAVNMKKYLSLQEYSANLEFVNVAAQLIDKQSQELARLNKEGVLENYKQTELQRILNDCYDNQGKAERLKKFPLPRQYGGFSFIFVCIFIFILPFGIVGEFSKLGDVGMWLAVPFGVIVGWVYVVMELIGDYSENPFEGLINDVPMFSICRNIEIDLLQMLGEKNLPPAVQPKKGILM